MKERLAGAAVLVIIAVIFIPMILDENKDNDIVINTSNIPPIPESIPKLPNDSDFNTRIIPLRPEPTEVPEPEKQLVEDQYPVIENLDSDENGDSVINESLPVEDNNTSLSDVGLSAWVVQLGSFSSKENAEALNMRLKEAGFRSFVEPLQQNNSTSYRVRVGPEINRDDAEKIKIKLNNSMELKGIVVEYP